jgi:hypothetical protein
LYVDVEPSTAISYDVRMPDEEVEFIIGNRTGSGNSLRLMLSDEKTFTELTRMLAQARDEFVLQVRKRRG